jgi:hypothetical protein
MMDFQGKNNVSGKERKSNKTGQTERALDFVRINGAGRSDSRMDSDFLKTKIDRCSHSQTFDSLCKHCLNESIITQQPVWTTIELLMQQSKFIRASCAIPLTTIRGNGAGSSEYSIASIESGDDPTVSDVQALLRATFKPEEVEREDVMRSAIDGRSPWNTPDTSNTRYRMLVVKDSSGAVLSVFTYAHLELLDMQGTHEPRSFLYGGYAATRADLRQYGLARELYISALMRTAAEAHGQGRTLLFAMGECKKTAERFWNGVGRKRIYVQANGTLDSTPVFEELPYSQPALNFDAHTGQIADGAGVMPEHLTIHKFSGEAPTKSEIIAGVKDIYLYSNTWPREAFDSDEAYHGHLEIAASLTADLERFMMSKGNVVLLSISERERVRSEGAVVLDHAPADARV